MNYMVLGWLRYFIPGILLYVLIASICWATSWCALAVPTNWQDFFNLTLAAALSFPYLAFRIRERSNQRYFDQVSANLVTRLTSPFAHDPAVPKGLAWRHVRSIFYNLVNSDDALTHHSQRAFFNGALWTSAADLRAISAIGFLLYLAAFLVGQMFEVAHFPLNRAVAGMFGCLALTALSAPLSQGFTNRQIEIGDEQIEHILMHHRQALRERLSQIQL